jgi:hypothetical protein
MDLRDLFGTADLIDPSTIRGPYCTWTLNHNHVVLTTVDGLPLEPTTYVAYLVIVGSDGVTRQRLEGHVPSNDQTSVSLQPVDGELHEYVRHLARDRFGREPRRRDGFFTIEKRRRDWVIRGSRPLFMKLDEEIAHEYQRLREAVGRLADVDWLILETNHEQFSIPNAHKGLFGISGHITGEILQNYPCFVWPHPERTNVGVVGTAYGKHVGSSSVKALDMRGVLGEIMQGSIGSSLGQLERNVFYGVTLPMAECNVLGAALGEIGRRAVINFLPEAIAIPINTAEDPTGSCEYQSWDTFEVRVGLQPMVLAERPRDGVVRRIVWRYMNKNGEPDRRYADNPAAYEIDIATVQLALAKDGSNNVNIHMSSHLAASNFAAALIEYQQYMSRLP